MTLKLGCDQIDLVARMGRIPFVEEQRGLPPITFLYPTLEKKYKKLGRNQRALPSDCSFNSDGEEDPDDPDSDSDKDPDNPDSDSGKPPKHSSRQDESVSKKSRKGKRHAEERERTSKPPKDSSRQEELFRELSRSRKRHAEEREKILEAQRRVNSMLTEGTKDYTERIIKAGTDDGHRMREEISRLQGCDPKTQCS